jgi:tetratricopeptide (TPR) repeat protein
LFVVAELTGNYCPKTFKLEKKTRKNARRIAFRLEPILQIETGARALFNLKLIESAKKLIKMARIPARILIFSFLVLCATSSLRAASSDLSRLRTELSEAEEAGDKAAIIELSRRIIAIAPKTSGTWETLLQTQFEAGDFDGAAKSLDAWQKAVKRPPAAIEDFRGDIFAQRKDYQNAERHWLAFLAKKPSAADAANTYDKLADLCADQARWTDSLAYRSKAIAAEDTAARRVFRACTLLRLHQWDAAFADMAKANKIDSTNEQVKEWLPQFERLERFLAGIKALDAQIAKSPNDAGLLLERARLFTLAGRPLLALDDCDHAMKLEPASMRVRIQTGEALLDVKRNEDAAKLQVSRVLARAPDGHVSEKALQELGEEDASIRQSPGKSEPLAARAKTLRELRQFALALADAQAALTIDDKSAAAHFEAAQDLDAFDNSKEALTHAVKATELNPNNGVAWHYRGVLEAERADFPAAIESQTRSLKLGETLDALRARENCERRIGQIEKADADLKRIRELEPRKE